MGKYICKIVRGKVCGEFECTKHLGKHHTFPKLKGVTPNASASTSRRKWLYKSGRPFLALNQRNQSAQRRDPPRRRNGLQLIALRLCVSYPLPGMEDIKRVMGLNLIPAAIRKRFKFEERHHAISILSADFAEEFKDIIAALESFQLKRSAIIVSGGGRSSIPQAIDGSLRSRGWDEKRFDIKITVDEHPIPIVTHKLDNVKHRVGVEVEWNNKTEFYDRDLNNFRLLWELRVLSVGVIITRLSELQEVFNELGIGPKYGNSTTHWDKLIPKVDSGGAGGCPLLLVGMGKECYDAKS